MVFSRKKPDPISERAANLSAEIAALEEQIKQLNARVEPHPEKEQPRLRSTARPHTASEASPPAVEPIFEELERPALRRPDQPAPRPDPVQELGVRKPGGTSFFRRVKNQFRPHSATNPKLVSYLAAGSIQGLRPLRYEKRVARNRFIFLVVALLLLLWGILAVLVNY